MHDLMIALIFLAIVTAPCMAAMSTGLHNTAEGDDPSGLV